MNAIKPVSKTAETVTLRRADYEAMLDALEDAEDRASIERHLAYVAKVGHDYAIASYYTIEDAKRILAGENRLLVWRQKRGLTQRALAAKAGIGVSYLSEIETGKKPGSVAAIRKLAAALEVPMDRLTG